jgi:membrane-associated protein
MNFTELIITFGYAGIALTLFAESGFLLGFFLPGDSLLFTVGILASQGYFNIYILVPLAIVAAILGDSLGYWMGSYVGERLLEKNSRFIKPEYTERTEAFFKKYGRKTIVLCRFIPIVRTFAPILAGIGEMSYSVFLAFNAIGGALWAGGFLIISYIIGKKIPAAQHYLTYIIIGIIFVSILPPAIDIFRGYLGRRAL